MNCIVCFSQRCKGIWIVCYALVNAARLYTIDESITYKSVCLSRLLTLYVFRICMLRSSPCQERYGVETAMSPTQVAPTQVSRIRTRETSGMDRLQDMQSQQYYVVTYVGVSATDSRDIGYGPATRHTQPIVLRSHLRYVVTYVGVSATDSRDKTYRANSQETPYGVETVTDSRDIARSLLTIGSVCLSSLYVCSGPCRETSIAYKVERHTESIDICHSTVDSICLSTLYVMLVSRHGLERI